MKVRILTAALIGVGLTACTQSDQIRSVLQKNPEIIFEAIEKNPTRFGEVVQKSMMEARRVAQEKAQQDRAREMEEQIKNPKKVAIEADRPVRGKKDAPMLLVIYSDFQCPYCQRGSNTVEELRQKYGDKMRVVFKHLPLDFHPMAKPAAKRFEAIAKQSVEKAWKFHDEVFKDQGKLQEGEKFLDEVAKRVGANLAQMKKDMESKAVLERIEADVKEAQSLGIRGSPGFLINGVVVHGAMPAQAFEDIIAKKPTYN